MRVSQSLCLSRCVNVFAWMLSCISRLITSASRSQRKYRENTEMDTLQGDTEMVTLADLGATKLNDVTTIQLGMFEAYNI